MTTVPSRPWTLTKVKVNVGAKVNIRWDHAKGSKKGSQQSDYTRRRQDKASPKKGVALTWRRQDKASPKQGAARERRRQTSHQKCYSPIPMGRKDHGGSDAMEASGPPSAETMMKGRERWLQGHSTSASGEQSDSRSAHVTPGRPLG